MFLGAHGGVHAFDKVVRRGRRVQVPLGYYQMLGMRDALAWVLGVDLHQMNAPKVELAPESELPDEVRATWIEAYGCYLVEFPPDEMQAQQQERAEFLSAKQAQELLDELRLHVLGRAYLTASEYEEMVRRDREERRARKQESRGALQASDASAAGSHVQLSGARAARAGRSSSSDPASVGALPEGV